MSETFTKRRWWKSTKHPLAQKLLVGFLALLLVLGGGIVLVYFHLQGNIHKLDITGALGKDRPTAIAQKGPTQPINVLVMGDDTRKGQTGVSGIGGYSPGNSDTTILLHLSADRKRAYGVSIPRDAMVQRPTCENKSGHGTTPAALTQFNAAYEIGGPACTIKTVESITHIRIDHFVVVNFNGFRDMVDALGGVEVCVPHAVDDASHQIHLNAGTYTVTGTQALAYVRERYGFGDGSDIGRMKRQQTFIAAMVKKATDAGTLANPVKLFEFLDAATKSLTTDPGFANLRSLVSLGMSLKSIGLDKIQFVTAPNQPYPPDINRLELSPLANKLFRRLADDKPLGKKLTGGAVKASDKIPGAKKGKGGTGTNPNGGSATAVSNGLCG